MAIFHAYIDESGQPDDHPVVTFSAVCISHHKLVAFDADWQKLLRQIQKPSLHMKKASRLKENYGPTMPRGQTFAERMNALRPFADCINEHFEIGIALATEVKGMDSWSERAKKAVGNPNDPFFVSFMRGVMQIVKYLQADDRLSLICDDDLKKAWDCYRFYRSLRQSDELVRGKTISLCFADDNYFPALQATDMLAFLFRLHARREIFGEFNQWGHLFDNLAVTRGPQTTQWYFHVGDAQKLINLGEKLGALKVPKRKRIKQ